MSWTYGADPANSPLDAVRLTLGDTNADIPLLMDEEINFALTTKKEVIPAAIQCCEYLISKYASDVDYKLGPESVKGSQRIDNFIKLLKELKKSLMLNSAVPLADVSEDRLFEVGMMDCRRLF
jgi:hypothetical protein